MKLKYPSTIPIFPLSGVIFFPGTSLPLNIFEERYLALVNDCIKSGSTYGCTSQDCVNSCEACNDYPQPPTGITCNTGNAGIVFTDDCDAQGNWTGNFGTSNGTWQVNDGGTASGGTGPDGAQRFLCEERQDRGQRPDVA